MKYKSIHSIFIYFILILGFCACAPTSDLYQVQSDIEGSPSYKSEYKATVTKWKLHSVKMKGKELANIPKKNFITLEMEGNKRFSGYSGCNGFSGDMEIKGNLIWFKQILSTSKNCPGNPGTESLIFNALKNVNNYYSKEGYLYLRHDNEVLIIYIEDDTISN